MAFVVSSRFGRFCETTARAFLCGIGRTIRDDEVCARSGEPGVASGVKQTMASQR
jgi:hypothetical protein